jgi:D-lyxose ketol-isomerase
MKAGLGFLNDMGFALPPFATWRPSEWKEKGAECRDIVRQQLGWDITDFGSGDFERTGLLLFSLRNGTKEDAAKEKGKAYAEKALIVQPGQVTPIHYHYQKMEDIINRGGGVLKIRFWNAAADDELADTEVELKVDGVKNTLSAGGILELGPGESVCIPQGLYHSFWADEGKEKVLVGEVSGINLLHVDNHFYDAIGPSSPIVEDEEPLHLIYDDYKNYYRLYDRIE